MKNFKLTAMAMVFAFASFQANAQFSISGGLSNINLFGGAGISSTGIGLKGEFVQNDDYLIIAGFNFYFPSNYSEETYSFANSSATSPSQTIVPVNYKVNITTLHVGIKKYFSGDYESDFGFYGIGGAGIFLGSETPEVGEYDKSKYYVTVQDGEKESVGGYTINLGLGIEKDLNFGYLFADTQLLLAAGETNSRTGSTAEFPSSFNINVGFRIPIN